MVSALRQAAILMFHSLWEVKRQDSEGWNDKTVRAKWQDSQGQNDKTVRGKMTRQWGQNDKTARGKMTRQWGVKWQDTVHKSQLLKEGNWFLSNLTPNEPWQFYQAEHSFWRERKAEVVILTEGSSTYHPYREAKLAHKCLVMMYDSIYKYWWHKMVNHFLAKPIKDCFLFLTRRRKWASRDTIMHCSVTDLCPKLKCRAARLRAAYLRLISSSGRLVLPVASPVSWALRSK